MTVGHWRTVSESASSDSGDTVIAFEASIDGVRIWFFWGNGKDSHRVCYKERVTCVAVVLMKQGVNITVHY